VQLFESSIMLIELTSTSIVRTFSCTCNLTKWLEECSHNITLFINCG